MNSPAEMRRGQQTHREWPPFAGRISLWLLWVAFSLSGQMAAAQDLTQWHALPAESRPRDVSPTGVTLQGRDWSYLVAPDDSTHVELAVTVTIEEPATQFGFFGSSWSVWPDPRFADQGFDAGLLLRADQDGSSGYRVQLSVKLQELALVRFPDGGYLRSVPCPLKPGTAYRLRASATGDVIRVFLDDQELIQHVDRLSPVPAAGRLGLGASSGARVVFSRLAINTVEPEPTPAAEPHRPDFSVRRWLGGRRWIFDGQEPILLLPSPESSYINNVKLRPGHRPQLSWNSHWDTQNQGAYNEAANRTVDVQTRGGGESIVASWRGEHAKNRFGTRTTMTVGFDPQRGTYTYDIASELEVFAGEPFHFRYGFDFEHHTPLDPFNWQYLVVRKQGGDLYHRPVYPIDPGPQRDLETYHGLRVWYGRHNQDLRVAPAVEYEIRPEWNLVQRPDGTSAPRKCHTAVCAAFYDTGVAFEAETAPPGTKVRVRYRYTGYPADEARRLFEQSRIYDSPMLDPQHHYVFADEWPRLTFSQFAPLSETWSYGRSPFLTGHNQRPTYELVKNCGAGSGFAMRLGPASFAKASLSKAPPLARGRYALTMLVKSENAHGPGGRLELELKQAKTGKELATVRHFVGNGSFDWTRQGFPFEVPEDAATVHIALGNAGTGNMLVSDIEFQRLPEPSPLPPGLAARPREEPPLVPPAPEGAIADFRMLEGQGQHVLNHAGGEHLALANLEWVVDEGRPALRFAERLPDQAGQADQAGQVDQVGNASPLSYPRDSSLGRNYLAHPSYAGKDRVPLALSGFHGGGAARKGLTLAAWIKPAARMGEGGQGNKGDILGYGARRFILGLHGREAPYRLAARINVNDVVESQVPIEAKRWSHVALTASPDQGQWDVVLYLDGRAIAEGRTSHFPSDSVVPDSLILGAEIFYFHDAFYRGLIGRTLVFDHPLSAAEISALAR